MLISAIGKSQDRIFYHTFKTTDSEIVLTQWRVDYESRGNKYIIETIDSSNRVTDIRLIENDKPYSSDCYNVSIIKFEYLGDTIIQYNMDTDSLYSVGIECGDPSRIEYIIVDNNLHKCTKFNYYDQVLEGNLNIDADFRKYIETEKEKNMDGNVCNAKYIWGYVFSSCKFKGLLPVKENFSFIEKPWYHYPYSENAANSEFAIQNSKYLRNINE